MLLKHMVRNQEGPTLFAVAQQIQDALNHVEAVAATPDGRQAAMLAQAVAHLRAGDLAAAQDAAFRACRGSLAQTRTTVITIGGGATATLAEIRADLYGVLAEVPHWTLIPFA